ncbi:uncharacterized protein LOC111258961 isoform X2 [Varroa jacobsoni]|uniref:uncharacterized protein LOC111258961 isoform X2 n=1 Tax=Varroa jacobsoni TaxID=62625 RepID=UPI000BF5BD18|nr:uncharacterized protein LOC111258961 isoform X2 [Varroa jacobsoni]
MVTVIPGLVIAYPRHGCYNPSTTLREFCYYRHRSETTSALAATKQDRTATVHRERGQKVVSTSMDKSWKLLWPSDGAYDLAVSQAGSPCWQTASISRTVSTRQQYLDCVCS